MDDTPKAPPPRRKAATGPRKTTRATPPKPKAPRASKAAGADGAAAPVKKPAARKPATRAKAADRAPAVKDAVKAAGERAGAAVSTAKDAASAAVDAVSSTAASARDAVTHSAPARLVSDTREKMGDRNFFAALIGGVAAIGATVAGVLYALRDGNPEGPAAKTRAAKRTPAKKD